MSATTKEPPRQARETALFVPELVYFEPASLDCPKGRRNWRPPA